MEDAKKANEERTWRHPELLVMVGLGLGVAYERLIYARPLGVSYPLWIGLCLGALFFMARQDEMKVTKWGWALSVPVFVLAALVGVRSEPLTAFLGVILSLWWLGVLVRALRPGRVLQWGWLDFADALVLVPLEAWLRPWGPLGQAQARVTVGSDARQRLFAVMRGALLAFPLLVLFLVLFSSADPIFGSRVEQALKWLNLERFFELLGRTTMILLAAIFSLGAMILAYRRSTNAGPILTESGISLPSLGLTEAVVVLGSVNLLFASFVVVQLTYFFGGEAAIGVEGYTYAEYARRGFGELVVISMMTLGLVTSLAVWVRNQRGGAWRAYQALGGVLVGLTGVILVSALQRLLLYEQAFGFTRLRTYSHAAIIWMGFLFAVFLVLLLLSRLSYFAPVLAAATILYAVGIAAVNIDAFIVEQNFARRDQIGELDVDYLRTLSYDAVPALVSRVDQLEDNPKSHIVADLLCRREALEQHWQESGWPARKWSHIRARSALRSMETEFDGYEINRESGSMEVLLPSGDSVACWRVGF